MSVPLPSVQVSVRFGVNSRLLGLGGDAQFHNWSFGSVIPGGNNAMQFDIADSERSAHTAAYQYGAMVTAKLGPDSPSAGQIVWQGYARTPVPNSDGTSTISAIGWQELVRERQAPLLWMTRDSTAFASADSLPYDPYFNNDVSIGTSVGQSAIQFWLNNGSNVNSGDAARILMWNQDATVSRIAGTITTTVNNPGNNVLLKLDRFQNPSSGAAGMTLVTDLTRNLATPSGANFDVTIATPQPMVGFRCYWQGASTKVFPYNFRYRITNVRWNDIAPGDIYRSDQMIADMASRLNFTTSLVSTGTNAMPYWHQAGPWANIMDDLAHHEGGWKWAVWDGPDFEFRPWGQGTTWTTKAYGSGATAEAQIGPSDDVYTAVRVTYTLVGSPVVHNSLAFTSQGILAGLSPPRARVFIFNMGNPQKDSTIADAVAARLATEFSAETYQGTIRLSYANDATADRTAYKIRAGDRITVTDYPGGSTTFRVTEVHATETDVTLNVSRRSMFFHRQREHGHWKHHGFG